jgi:hypothetical protein
LILTNVDGHQFGAGDIFHVRILTAVPNVGSMAGVVGGALCFSSRRRRV